MEHRNSGCSTRPLQKALDPPKTERAPVLPSWAASRTGSPNFGAAGEDSFSIGASTRQATRYVLKVEIGGVAGVVAPLVGKQPPDIHVWIQGGGTAPSFVKMQGPLYSGGPIWVIQPASPVWPRVPPAAEKR